ncbi:MAG: C40 family peptidase [Sphingobacteriales bacterium]|nr:C40 family peptidase [Sphingobacteriales bacterium]
MNYLYHFLLIILILPLLFSCNQIHNRSNVIAAKKSILDTGQQYIALAKDSVKVLKDSSQTSNENAHILTADTTQMASSPEALVAFALTLEGTPYIYGGQNPEQGFDNSGFVNYVFKHFSINVPRFSGEFANVGRPIAYTEAVPGDIVLFSSTDSIKKVVSHIGIITSEVGEQPITFIHASSGKVRAVTVTPMNSYYQKRLIGIRSLFK